MKQHYVPRFYLRRFSDNEKSIFTYDKQLSKTYSASMMSVCCEDDIYTISDKYVKDSNNRTGSNINKFSLEKDHFAKIEEPLYAKLLQEIDKIKDEWISGKNQYRLKFLEKRELALHLVTQYFRHPILKDSTVDDYIRMERAGIDMVKCIMANAENNEAFNDLKVDITCEKPVLHANLTYRDSETLMMFANAIATNIWLFEISEGKNFYTSDFPLVVEPHAKDARPMFMGLAQYGGELTYPLSPSLMLVSYDRAFFKDLENEDCSFKIVDAKEVRRQNMLRYFYANRHLFSYNKDFSLIDFIYKCNGGHHVFMKPNFKSEIVSGLGRY